MKQSLCEQNPRLVKKCINVLCNRGFVTTDHYICIMDFNTFAQDKVDCHVSESGFLLWLMTGEDADCIPCSFDEDDNAIIVHILVCEGELGVQPADDRHMLMPGSFASFIDLQRIKLLSASSDLKAYVMVIKDCYAKALLKHNPPIPFSYVLKMRKNPVEMPDDEMMRRLCRRMENVREACVDTDNVFRDKLIKCAIWMLLMDIADRHIRNGGLKDPADNTDRAMQLFTGFMKMLPVHAISEHFATFYADRLCVTTQYLNRIVKTLSNRTVSGWINYTLVGEITKRLENTDDSMQQIAADLNFPNQAALTKFYKRETGYSLTEYKKNARAQ